MPTGVSVKEGRFAIWRLSPGRYSIIAACQGAPCATGRMPVKASAPVEFTVGDAHVDNIAKFEGVRVALHTGNVSGGYGTYPAKPNPDGAFVVSDLLAHNYRVVAESPGVYVKSVQVGPAVMPSDVADLRRPPGVDVMTVTLSTAVGEIAGLVQDAKGLVAGALLALLPETPDVFNRTRFTTTDAAGRYTFRSLPPDVYRLGRIEPRDRLSYLWGAPLGERESTTVTVAAGDKVARDLKTP